MYKSGTFEGAISVICAENDNLDLDSDFNTSLLYSCTWAKKLWGSHSVTNVTLHNDSQFWTMYVSCREVVGLCTASLSMCHALGQVLVLRMMSWGLVCHCPSNDRSSDRLVINESSIDEVKVELLIPVEKLHLTHPTYQPWNTQGRWQEYS